MRKGIGGHRTGLRKRIMGSGHPVVPLMEEGGSGGSMAVTQSSGRNTLAHFYGFPVRGGGKKRGAGRRVEEEGIRAARGRQIWTTGAI